MTVSIGMLNVYCCDEHIYQLANKPEGSQLPYGSVRLSMILPRSCCVLHELKMRAHPPDCSDVDTRTISPNLWPSCNVRIWINLKSISSITCMGQQDYSWNYSQNRQAIGSSYQGIRLKFLLPWLTTWFASDRRLAWTAVSLCVSSKISPRFHWLFSRKYCHLSQALEWSKTAGKFDTGFLSTF